MTEIFLIPCLAHLAADFPLQSGALVKRKARGAAAPYLHHGAIAPHAQVICMRTPGHGMQPWRRQGSHLRRDPIRAGAALPCPARPLVAPGAAAGAPIPPRARSTRTRRRKAEEIPPRRIAA